MSKLHLPIETMDAAEVATLLRAGKLLLIDVREPAEFQAERIAGALLYPLSTFDAAALPEDGVRKVVFHCGSGKRSLTVQSNADHARARELLERTEKLCLVANSLRGERALEVQVREIAAV